MSGTHRGRRLLVVGVAFLAACNPGAYPIDIFTEMHYQPSQRYLEPERLAPPADAVPVSGSHPAYTFEEASALPNPIVRNPQVLERAGRLYAINCATCHGPAGRGDGAMAPYYRRSSAAPVPPVDFASPRVRARSDGELYWLTANGIGNMPPFRQLLIEAEIWHLVHFVRRVQEG